MGARKRGKRERKGKDRKRAKKGDGEEEKQEVGKTWRWKSGEKNGWAGSSTGRANYKTQLKWYHENALSNIVSTRRV